MRDDDGFVDCASACPRTADEMKIHAGGSSDDGYVKVVNRSRWSVRLRRVVRDTTKIFPTLTWKLAAVLADDVKS